MSKKPNRTLIGKPARPGYALVVDHKASKEYGIRMVKWVPKEESK